jgi:hypothetical protein
MENPNSIRYTTIEAARILQCRRVQAVQILRAAGILPVHCGPAYLWDAAAVERLATVLHQTPSALPAEGGQHEA